MIKHGAEFYGNLLKFDYQNLLLSKIYLITEIDNSLNQILLYRDTLDNKETVFQVVCDSEPSIWITIEKDLTRIYYLKEITEYS